MKEDQNQQSYEKQYDAIKFLDWRLNGFYQEINNINISLYVVKNNDIPSPKTKIAYFDKPETDPNESIESYFCSNIDHL